MSSPIFADDDTYAESTNAFNYQPDCVEHQESEQDHIGLLNSDATVTNGLSGLLTDSSTKAAGDIAVLEDITVDFRGGHQFTLTCEQPITLKSVISKITGHAKVMGDLMLTYHLDGGNELITISSNEQMQRYLQLPVRLNLHVQQLK